MFFPRVWCNDIPTESWNLSRESANHKVDGDYCQLPKALKESHKHECGCPFPAGFCTSPTFIPAYSIHPQEDTNMLQGVRDGIYSTRRLTFQPLFCGCCISGYCWSISQTSGVADSTKKSQAVWTDGVGNQLTSHKSSTFLAFWWFRGPILGSEWWTHGIW